MKRLITCAMVIVLVGGVFVSPSVQAASTKTYTYTADKYSFTYPSTWTIKKNAKSVNVIPPSTSLKSLLAKGVSYGASVQLLNNDATVLTASLKNTLKKSWSGFVSAYSKTLAKKLGATVVISAHTRSGWNASQLTFTKTVSGVKTTWRVVLLSSDKANVYSVSEKWAKQSTSPFAAIMAALVKSLTPFANVSWSFNGTKWVASGTPPTCQLPLIIPSPVDVFKATSILYPGQYRSGNYKAHGGFRLDNIATGDIAVHVPQDAKVVDGASYLEFGERQYLFDLHAPCGIQYRFDHLRTLSPEFAALAALLPQNGESDTRTTAFTKPVIAKAGAAIATAVGFLDTTNFSFDFGVYDLRQRNAVSANAAFATEHANNIQQTYYALCWLDLLPSADATFVNSLPAADGVSGSNSDYCN